MLRPVLKWIKNISLLHLKIFSEAFQLAAGGMLLWKDVLSPGGRTHLELNYMWLKAPSLQWELHWNKAQVFDFWREVKYLLKSWREEQFHEYCLMFRSGGEGVLSFLLSLWILINSGIIPGWSSGESSETHCEKTELACSSEVIMYQTSERWGKELITIIISKAQC